MEPSEGPTCKTSTVMPSRKVSSAPWLQPQPDAPDEAGASRKTSTMVNKKMSMSQMRYQMAIQNVVSQVFCLCIRNMLQYCPAMQKAVADQGATIQSPGGGGGGGLEYF